MWWIIGGVVLLLVVVFVVWFVWELIHTPVVPEFLDGFFDENGEKDVALEE